MVILQVAGALTLSVSHGFYFRLEFIHACSTFPRIGDRVVAEKPTENVSRETLKIEGVEAADNVKTWFSPQPLSLGFLRVPYYFWISRSRPSLIPLNISDPIVLEEI